MVRRVVRGDEQEEKKIEHVRSLLDDEENGRCCDATIRRYIRAVGKNGTIHAVVKRLKATLAWWKEEKPEEMSCGACRVNASSHYMQVVCFDQSGRPTIYSCFELATNRDVEENRIHMISTFETAISVMPPGVESWNWVLDFHGFSIKDCDPRLAKIFLNLAAEHYPERLGHFFIVDAPSLFSTLWKAIKPFIDPKTKEKIMFLSLSSRSKKEDAVAAFQTYFDEDTVQWMIDEIHDNRKKRANGEKTYSYEDLGRSLVFGVQCGGHPGVQQHNHLYGPGFVEGIRCLPQGVPARLTRFAVANGES